MYHSHGEHWYFVATEELSLAVKYWVACSRLFKIVAECEEFFGSSVDFGVSRAGVWELAFEVIVSDAFNIEDVLLWRVDFYLEREVDFDKGEGSLLMLDQCRVRCSILLEWDVFHVANHDFYDFNRLQEDSDLAQIAKMCDTFFPFL